MRMLLVLTLLASAACAGAPREEMVQGIPASSLGLAPGDLAADPAPKAFTMNATEPGEVPVAPRAYEISPPVVPHGVADFMPITREENLCLECHMVEEKIEGEATPVPPSHYTDLHNSPDRAGEEVNGARWNCTTCHAPQSGAEPLVPNVFNARKANQ